MSKYLPLILLILILITALLAIVQYQPAAAYAAAWDAGQTPADFAIWSKLEPPSESWINRCRWRLAAHIVQPEPR